MVSKLTEKGYGQSEVAALVSPFRAKSHPLSSGQAMRAGLWRNATRSLGLSLGDRCCLALAMDLKATVFTADRAWAGLDLGIPIRVIR